FPGARIGVVLIAITVIFAPLVAALAFASPLQATVTASAIIIAAASATAIQLWFRVQARRSQFRRRQTSSRLATFAEAFSSIGWAATAALLLTLPIAGMISGLITTGLIAATWKFSPRRDSHCHTDALLIRTRWPPAGLRDRLPRPPRGRTYVATAICGPCVARRIPCACPCPAAATQRMPGDGECAAARDAGGLAAGSERGRGRDHLCRPFHLFH